MKNLIYLSFGVVLAGAAACTSYAKTISTYEITPKQTEIANKRWSESNEAKLKHGKSIFTVQCTECHKAFVIEKFSEKKWNHEIDDMSPKAKLTAEEKQDLTYFVLSYLEMKQPAK
ncbi:MAG: hypothetical protein H0W61_11795 [Bacteroidetes bacterium]|nr:hypothetical protein [Bacteroidota bacterium]